MNPGTRVRMSKALKKEMRKTSQAHIKEFGNCVGVVMGLMDYGTQLGPEVDVRWLPSNLCYGYLPETLDVVENIAQPKSNWHCGPDEGR
jgi:hypothetical protein